MEETQELIDRLNQSGKRLSKSHKRIADYIVNHYDKAAFLTASRLGSLVGVSESTVVRFANALGYEGYPQLQRALQELIRHRLTAQQRFEMAADLEQSDVLATVFKADMQNIRSTLDTNKPDTFNRVIELMRNAHHIYILGLRSSAPLAEFMGFYLRYVTENVTVVTSGISDVFEQLSRISSGDVLICISFPRYSARTVEAMEFAGSRGAKLVAITDGPMSPLSSRADLSLVAKSDMASYVDSLTAPLSLINAILVAMGLANRDAVSAHLQELEGIWDTYHMYLGKESGDQ